MGEDLKLGLKNDRATQTLTAAKNRRECYPQRGCPRDIGLIESSYERIDWDYLYVRPIILTGAAARRVARFCTRNTSHFQCEAQRPKMPAFPHGLGAFARASSAPTMFTGIIQAVGHITQLVETTGGDARVTFAAGGLDLAEAQLGDSIACNGVCLTVVDKSATSFSVDVSAETFSCTIGFAPGDQVNLEMAMRLSDRLGGHLVSGHVDGVGEVLHFAPVAGKAGQDGSWRLDIRAPGHLGRYLVPKGSIAVNGVSLTVNKVLGTDFSINLIPHTLEQTMLQAMRVGGKVNLEADMLARYADRLLNYVHEQDKD